MVNKNDAVGVRVAVISPTAVASIPSPVQSGIVPPTVSVQTKEPGAALSTPIEKDSPTFIFCPPI
jgi:hypothetical protein